MEEAPPPVHSFTFIGRKSGYLHPQPLSDLSNTQPSLHGTHSPPSSHYAPGWRPMTIDEYNGWNTSSQGMSPSTLIGPGHNPGPLPPTPLPHPQTRHPTRTTTASTKNPHPRKRRRVTPSGSGETSSVGGYGPTPPGAATTETGSPHPSPLPFSPSSARRNAAHDVWAFARPLTCKEEPAEWPAPTGPLKRKPRSQWFGCTLCSQFGYVICLSSVLRSSTLIFSRFRDDQRGIKQWKVFKNCLKSSPTAPFRRHLREHHVAVWTRECARLNIPLKAPVQEGGGPTLVVPEIEPFTREGLLERLIKFILGDDQVRSQQGSCTGGSFVHRNRSQ